MRRVIKITAGVMGGVLFVAIVGVVGVMIAGNTAPGRAWIERLTYQLTGGYVRLTGLAGEFPSHLTLRELQLVDRNGTWLVANEVTASWSPLRLLERRIQILDLQVGRLHMERAPVGDGKGGKASVPDIEVAQFASPTVELGAPLAGSLTILSLEGGIRLRSLDDAKADVVAHRLNGAGDYTAHVRFDPKRMDVSLALHEPANGPLENILSLPGLGALQATASLQGPRNAEVVHVDLAAGELRALVQGRVDLAHAAADLDYSLTAPAMAPRPDVAWDAVALHGTWHGALAAASAQATLDIARLRIAGTTQVASLTAKLEANQGNFDLHAAVGGLEIPGAQPRLFAADPLTIEAALHWDTASRPFEINVKHPLLTLQGRTDFARQIPGQTNVAFDLRFPDLAAFATLTGQDMRGSALLKGRWTHVQKGHEGPDHERTDHERTEELLSLDGTVGLTGGTANWIALAGPRVALQLSGGVTQSRVTIDNARVDGRALTFAASGGADRLSAPTAAQSIKNLQFRWQLDMPDLNSLTADLRGQVKATGHVSGSLPALAADAEIASRLSVRDSPSGNVTASVRAGGLPKKPSGTIQAHGMLDGAPLNLDATVERSGADLLRVAVRQADWKSIHVEGDLSADTALTSSHGKLALHIAQLSDLDRLLGVNLSGSLEGDAAFIPARGETQGQMHLDGKNLVVGGFAGNLHLDAVGVPSALGLKLTVDAPNLYGAPANLQSSAELDLKTIELRLDSAALGYRGETIKMLAPAALTFGKGLAVDDLRVGVRDAVLDIKGQLTPALELRGSLSQIRPDLINVFAPDLLASGEIEARAHLQGTLAIPTGTIRVLARDIRFADDDATGLPAVALRGRADLAEGRAALDATLTAGVGSKLTATGSVPLESAGALTVKIGGTLDLGLANPFLEARGLHATGQLGTDAALSGSLDSPQIVGEITLARGSLRDYGRGINLSDISAQVVGDQSGVKIQSFQAKAASGTLSMTGTIGLLQPGMPLDLRIHAKNAQPIASSIVTANLDADVHVSGTARQRLDVGGKIHVIRATIGIPNSLPPDVAVLDVRRRGQVAPVDSGTQLVIGMDITVEAPQQILVQGRGLDAEMGGEIHLTGTTDAPLAAGGLDLQRGSFTLAGNKLTFTQGRVSFDGAGLKKKIDPTLDFTAQTSLSSTTATLRITGLADAPRFDFSSSPVLPQDEIMAQLLFGENAAQLTALQAAEIGAALATLSGVGSASNPLVRLQKSLGLDRLSVGSNTTTSATGTESSGAAIEAGRYISKRVYVEGKQSTQGTSQVQVDVDLTKHLKLQTRLGNGTATTQGTTPENDPGSSIGLSYQFEY